MVDFPVIREIKATDLKDIIELQGLVWQDYFLKEYGKQLPPVHRTNKNLGYYLEKEPDGCFLAEKDGKIVGAIYSHAWGRVGWFGPLEVASSHQGQGIGKALVAKAVQHLRAKQCTTIGLETMAGSAKNVAFYSKMGFKTKAFSYVLFKKLVKTNKRSVQFGTREFKPETDMASAKLLWNAVQPGLDYEIEFNFVNAHALGCALAMDTEHGPAHALLHTYEMFEPSENAIIKLIAASEGNEHAVERLLEACEIRAMESDKTGIFVRKYAATPPDVNIFFRRGYVMQGTSVRMILQGDDEAGENLHASCWSG